MIFLGTDIIPISRIDKIIKKKGNIFLNRVFTENEKSICSNRSIPAIHYSGKFAAKEAIKKAILSSKLILNISLRSIEIQNDKYGAPIAIVLINLSYSSIQVSISHAGDYATATAILQL